MQTKKRLKKSLLILLCLAVVGVAMLLIVNGYVKSVAKDRILTTENVAELEDVDCIIVLGCQVRDDGSLSHMLRDRLMRSLEVYNAGAAPKLLMSGDHGRKDYDEVGAMKQYAIDNGVPSENVFMDHAGFSTYETVYRAKKIFEADKVIIITQEYHLYRALYIAEKLGIEAYGVSADLNRYAGQSMRDFREILARCKDFAKCVFKPKPTYLGDVIPVGGNGDLTNG
ncbi:MAG: YdcF family protein [Oscillospiraceae bacterium]|nr:YdcF family protein [Oscillospiraceae bacterium]